MSLIPLRNNVYNILSKHVEEIWIESIFELSTKC